MLDILHFEKRLAGENQFTKPWLVKRISNMEQNREVSFMHVRWSITQGDQKSSAFLPSGGDVYAASSWSWVTTWPTDYDRS